MKHNNFMGILRKIYRFSIDTTQQLVLTFAVFAVIYIFLFRPFQVSGNSMYPNFFDKEYVLTNVITLRFNKPKLGDVIVFKAPDNPQKDYIKRVIGLPGDIIEIENGNVYINERPLDQNSYLDPLVKTYGGSFLKEHMAITVPDNAYFVLGDNRTGSSDSREWGFVPLSNIVGQSMLTYWPINKLGFIKNPYN